jgi:putative nucleotidyltransferase with HDIG domain/PAS domain S-box-containing protein
MRVQDKDKVSRVLDEHVKDWQVLIEALPYPVSIHDTDLNVVMANKGFIDVCGVTDVIGKKCYQLIHCKDQPAQDCPMAKTLRSGKSERSEIYEPILKKYLLVQTSPITVGTDLVGVIHSVIDINEIKQSEASYKELLDVYGDIVNKLKEREQVLSKGKDAFLNMLEDVSEAYKNLEDLFIGLVKVMVNALDAKSQWTRGHSERVANYAVWIAEVIGLDDDEIKDLQLAGLLHDIGKIGTYDHLLDKPTKLTEEEFAVVKKHPAQGALILKDIKQLRDVIPIIRHHHERIDGRGYPDGLRNDEIPLGARILHVADTFDAIMADRPYRPSRGIDYAVSELKKYSGTQFDSEVVEAFLKVISKVE